MTAHGSIALVTASALAGATMLACVSTVAAQDGAAFATDFSSQQDKKQLQQKKAVPPKAGAPRIAPQQVTPRAMPRQVTPRTITPGTAPKVVAPKKIAPGVVAPKTVAPGAVTPKVVAPKVVAPKVAPKIVTPTGPKASVVTAGKLRGIPLRGAGKTVIDGRDFTVWRRGYRVRHDGRWRTFVALSALGAIAIGAAYYYPYAYVAAPEPFCEGLTADGCRLMWQEVQTIEGDFIYQCVAYCPWQ
jgi:hypothetical protein